MGLLSAALRPPFYKTRIYIPRLALSKRAWTEVMTETLFFALCALCASSFRHAAETSSFGGYDVLYTANSEAAKLETALGGEREAIIMRSTQGVPLPLDMASLLPASSAMNMADFSFAYALEKSTDYLAKRLEYFTDASGENTIFYVRAGEAARVKNAIASSAVDAHYLAASHSNFLLVAIVLLAAVLCYAMRDEKRKVHHLRSRGQRSLSAIESSSLVSKASGVINGGVRCLPILPILLVYSRPYPFVAISSALMMCAFYDARRMWQRPHSLRAIMRRVAAPLLLLLSLVAGIIGQAGVLCALSIAGTFAAMRASHIIRKGIDEGHRFCPVPILHAASSWKKGDTLSMVCAVLMCAILPFMGTKESAPSGIKMPSSLVGIEDYYKWCYGILTYPYTRAGDESAIFPVYKEENGVIKQDIIEIKLDNAMKARIADAIDSLPAAEVEHLMKSSAVRHSALASSTAEQE